MSETATTTVTSTVIKSLTTLKPPKKLKPARKQVKPGDVEKKETVQTGKEYSKFCNQLNSFIYSLSLLDIWYNKWAGGDREDNYSKCVVNPPSI